MRMPLGGRGTQAWWHAHPGLKPGDAATTTSSQVSVRRNGDGLDPEVGTIAPYAAPQASPGRRHAWYGQAPVPPAPHEKRDSCQRHGSLGPATSGQAPRGVHGRFGGSANRYLPQVIRYFEQLASASRHLPPVRGRRPIAIRLFKRYVETAADAPSATWTIPMALGHKMAVPVTARQTWSAAFTGAYDDDQVTFLAQNIRPSTVVVDVGASLGFYTVPLGIQAARLDARVLAVEPVPGNVAVIRNNVELNDLGATVTVAPVGVGAEPGEMDMYVERGGFGNGTVVEDGVAAPQHGEGRATVPVVPLDDLVNEPCSVIKMDVEGFEMAVLAGAKRVIGSSRPLILGEFSEAGMRARGIEMSDLADWSNDNGYVVARARRSVVSRWSDRRTVTLSTKGFCGARRGDDLVLLPVEV